MSQTTNLSDYENEVLSILRQLQAKFGAGVGSSEDASTTNTDTTIERITQVRDRLPSTVASESTLVDNLGTIDSPIANSVGEYGTNNNIISTYPWNINSLLKGILAQALRITPIQNLIYQIYAQLDENLTQISNRLPQNSQFITSPFTGNFFDHSGTIITASISQSIPLAYAMHLGYFLLQNTSNQDLWFNFGQPATNDSPSIKLLPGESFTMEGSCLFISNAGVRIIGETAGQTFTCKVIYSGVGNSD